MMKMTLWSTRCSYPDVRGPLLCVALDSPAKSLSPGPYRTLQRIDNDISIENVWTLRRGSFCVQSSMNDKAPADGSKIVRHTHPSDVVLSSLSMTISATIQGRISWWTILIDEEHRAFLMPCRGYSVFPRGPAE